jgi:hypothetical protein
LKLAVSFIVVSVKFNCWILTRGNVNIYSLFNKILERRFKGKAIPLQALTDPEGSRRLRLPDVKTTGT